MDRCLRLLRLAAAALAVLLLVLPPPLALAVQPVDGDLDPEFGAGFGYVVAGFDLGSFGSDLATSVARTEEDRLVVAGTVTLGDSALPRAIGVTQFLWNGAPDNPFGGGDARVHYSWGTSMWELAAMAVLPDGEIVIAGSVLLSTTDSDFLVLRLLPDGQLDPRFGGGDGFVTVPFDVNPGGSNHDLASSLAVTTSGDLLVAGSVQRSATDYDMALARLTASGVLDDAFGGGTGKVVVPFDWGGYAGFDVASAVLIVPGGEIALVGSCENGGASRTDFAFALLDNGGSLVPGFGTGGRLVVGFDLGGLGPDDANAATVDTRGRILAAGRTRNASGTFEAAVACVTSSGAPCPDFGTGGKVHFPFSAAPQGDESLTGIAVDDLGRIVAGGRALATSSNNRDVAVVRLLPGGALDPGFAGTGIRLFELNHGPGQDDDEALALVLLAGKPVLVGATEYDSVDDDYFVLRVWVSLVQADGFESGQFSGWSSRP